MSHQLLTAAGYSLPVVPARDATSLLQQAICATWPRDVIALRNAHLAAELVQRAISNRNKRMALPRLLCAPLALSEADLGVESEGLQSLLAKRREVEEEVSQHHVTPATSIT